MVHSDICILNNQGSKVLKQLDECPYDNGGYFSYEDSNSGLMGDTPSLCWSPDGKQIAFTNELSKIYVVNTDHSGYKLVVDMKGNGFLSWGK